MSATRSTAPVGKRSARWERPASSDIQQLNTLKDTDYSDMFSGRAADAASKSAEEWARIAMESAPEPLQLLVIYIQRLLLGFRLAPRHSPGHVLGWTVAEHGENWVRLETSSWLMTPNLVFKVDDEGLQAGAFIRYERRVAALIWRPLSLVHRAVGVAMMRHAMEVG